LPALIALVALLLLTALVWWRVLHRGGGAPAATPCPTPTAQSSLPDPGQVTVQVLNSTKRNGIAARARTALVEDGFNVPAAAANDRPKTHITAVAEIRSGVKGRPGATLLHYYFPGARMVATNSRSAVVVVSLGDKYHGVASRSSVEAALQRQRVTVGSSGPGAPSGSASC
jgi:hypothetical protein